MYYGDFMTCTFFGHRSINDNISSELESVLHDLIENENVNLFYVGNNGDFDMLVQKNLKHLKNIYPHIKCFTVIAYIPSSCAKPEQNLDSIYPDGLENTPPKFAISKRNKWMIDKSDYVVTYVKYSTGGAAKFKEFSEKEGKKIINIADMEQDITL